MDESIGQSICLLFHFFGQQHCGHHNLNYLTCSLISINFSHQFHYYCYLGFEVIQIELSSFKSFPVFGLNNILPPLFLILRTIGLAVFGSNLLCSCDCLISSICLLAMRNFSSWESLLGCHTNALLVPNPPPSRSIRMNFLAEEISDILRFAFF